MHEGEPIWLFKVLAYFLCGTKNRHLILVSNSLYIINNLFSRIFRLYEEEMCIVQNPCDRNSVMITRSISKVLKVFYNHKIGWPLNGVNQHINGCILCIYSWPRCWNELGKLSYVCLLLFQSLREVIPHVHQSRKLSKIET